MKVSAAFDPARAISHGWGLFKENPGGLILGYFVLFMADACGNGNNKGGFNTHELENMDGAALAAWLKEHTDAEEREDADLPREATDAAHTLLRRYARLGLFIG